MASFFKSSPSLGHPDNDENQNSSNSRPSTPLDEKALARGRLSPCAPFNLCDLTTSPFNSSIANASVNAKANSNSNSIDIDIDSSSSSDSDEVQVLSSNQNQSNLSLRRMRLGLSSPSSSSPPASSSPQSPPPPLPPPLPPPPPESPASKELREQAESEALARELMAEEALASYSVSADFLRDNADQFSEEDLAALQAAMREEGGEGEEDGENEEEGMGMIDEGDESSRELSYETLLSLGERIGDVKTERWVLKAEEEIKKLTTSAFNAEATLNNEKNDSEVKCLVCQNEYEDGEQLTNLPCKHVFHSECVEGWLMRKDCCPYCRQCIV